MNNFYETKGILSVSIGEGYLSSFEISTLKPGDIIKTSKLAGYSSTIYFNGDFLCHGEIVIIGHLFGVRVTHLSEIDIPERVPSNSDDVLEILPIKIEIGKINLSPRDLKSIGYGTIISLAKPYTEEYTELAVAGVPVASGKVVVIYENMSLKISKIYGSQFEEDNIRTSGFFIGNNVSVREQDVEEFIQRLTDLGIIGYIYEHAASIPVRTVCNQEHLNWTYYLRFGYLFKRQRWLARCK